MNWHEVNFDGLVGPTHNYAGLAYGNLASDKNRNRESNPKKAALEGIEKMRVLFELGVEQAILPPQLRPDLRFLRQVGFLGPFEEVIRKAAQMDPAMLAAASSSAFMWTANAATVTPSPDSLDQSVHFTPANLLSGLHRSLESSSASRLLNLLFSNDEFQIHAPLPSAAALSDEGAANHMRLTESHGQSGIEIFVYGQDAFDNSKTTSVTYPARQSLQASQSVARLHQLDPNRVCFWKQNPAAIDHGAFHNDVVAVANENVLFCHELAFENQNRCVEELNIAYESIFSSKPIVIEVAQDDLSLKEAVDTYLFNSQIVTLPSNEMALIAPSECDESKNVRRIIDQVIKDENPITKVFFPDVRQSMRNGGGPACLRLRVVMNDDQLDRMHPHVRFSPELEKNLTEWVGRFYRDSISPSDLGDASLYQESTTALTQLESMLELPAGSLVPLTTDLN